MNTYINEKQKSQCCGCAMCSFVCPTKAIQMNYDFEGFAFPEVNAEVCVNCNKCKAVCPIDTENKYTQETSAYAAYSKDRNTVKTSSSGGIFAELAKKTVMDGGYVCGCTIDDAHQVKHIVIDRMEDIPLLQGSKYVQSDLGNCLEQLASLIKQGKNVLFVGTPCQVSAVKNQFPSNNLTTVDLLCHGVPSQKLFDFYIKYLEQKHKGKLTEIVFRDKELNGWSITQRYKIQKGSKEKTFYLDRHISEYFSGFLRNMTQRESCFCCPYTTLNRVGDVTLADFWGVDKVRPELFHKEGTSLVFSNSPNGDRMIESIKENIVLEPVTKNEAVFQNVNLVAPPERDPKRSFIYNEIYNNGFISAGKKYILPPNAYKYRLWALLQKLHIVKTLNDWRK